MRLLASGTLLHGFKQATGLASQKPVPAGRTLRVRQQEYPGGVQIWGSNPAIIWSAEKAEEEGIHVHAFKGEDSKPDVMRPFPRSPSMA